MVAGGEEAGFVSGATVIDGIYGVDDILCREAIIFCEFGFDYGAHLKRGVIHLLEIRFLSARSVRGQCAQRESGFLCVMVGVFVCDG